MRKIKLYVAVSLDAKIARPDGDVNWLHDFPNPDKTDHGYGMFYDSIDITLMGHNTYKMIQSFDVDFPYKDKENYVFTRNSSLQDNDDVIYISSNIASFVKSLKKQPGKDIWVVGGGEINTLLLDNDLVDEMCIFIMPIILGDGLPLFAGNPHTNLLTLQSSTSYSTGAVELVYAVPDDATK